MNWRSPAVTLVLLAGVLTAILVPALSRAARPGRNGRIAYMVQDRAGHWQIWVANSDLSGAKKLTHGRYDSGWAVWSPDGKQLAFDSSRTDRTPNDSRPVNDVFVMRPDGSDVKKLTDSKGMSGDAAWSPSGRLIALSADRGNRKGLSAIYVIRANGRKLRRVTRPRPPLSDYEPRFSADGTHLVFARTRGTSDNAPAALFTVRLDGSGLHRLTAFSLHVGASDWSPDGKRIVFEGYPNGPYGDIYVVSATAGRVVNLTHDSYGQADPTWSPDGRKILFLDNGFENGIGRTGLATMNPDGSAVHFLSSKNLEAHQPDWESVPTGAQRTARRELDYETGATKVRNGPPTLFSIDNSGNAIARIAAVAGSRTTTLWHCSTRVFWSANAGRPISRGRPTAPASPTTAGRASTCSSCTVRATSPFQPAPRLTGPRGRRAGPGSRFRPG